jgi:hypothetical protein
VKRNSDWRQIQEKRSREDKGGSGNSYIKGDILQKKTYPRMKVRRQVPILDKTTKTL